MAVRGAHPAVTRHELLGVGLWSLLVTAMASVPYVIGWARGTDAAPFVGMLNYWQADTAYHLSFARQAAEGQLLFENKYLGGAATGPAIFNLLFLGIGLVARVLAVSLPVAFNLVRALSACALLCFAYLLAARVFAGRGLRWLALILASFSSGLGWLAMLGLGRNHESCDLWLIEVSTFWAIRWEVVVPPVVALLLLVFYLAGRYIDTARQRFAIGAGAAMLLLAAVHPHDVLTASIVIVLALLARVLWGRLRGPAADGRAGACRVGEVVKGGLWMLLPVAPLMAYHLRVLLDVPGYGQYVRIVDPLSAPQLLSGFGLMALLGIAGAAIAVRDRRWGCDLCVLWAVTGCVLAFIPVPPFHQVYTLHGVHVALCILSVVAVERLVAQSASWGRWRRRALLVIGLALLPLTALTNALHYANEIVLLRGSARVPFPHRDLTAALEWFCAHTLGGRPGCAASPYYLPGEILEVTSWLARETQGDETVLALPGVGILLPYLVGARVLLPMEDQPGYAERLEVVERFFDSSRPGAAGERAAFLRKEGVSWVLIDRALPQSDGTALEPALQEIPGLSKAYADSRFAVYRYVP